MIVRSFMVMAQTGSAWSSSLYSDLLNPLAWGVLLLLINAGLAGSFLLYKSLCNLALV